MYRIRHIDRRTQTNDTEQQKGIFITNEYSEFNKDPNLLIDIIHQEDKEFVENSYKTFAENSDKVLQIDFRIIAKDNQVKWISQISREVKNENDEILGLRISNRDITERKLADEELKNSEERFKTLFIDSPDAVFVEDYDGNILDVNPAACRINMASSAFSMMTL